MAEAVLCSRCGAPLEGDLGGGEARCAFCGTTTVVARSLQTNDPVKARELAKAIADDIALYGAFDAKTAPDARESEVVKGRGLFQRKVAPELHAVFEAEIERRARRAGRS